MQVHSNISLLLCVGGNFHNNTFAGVASSIAPPLSREYFKIKSRYRVTAPGSNVSMFS